MHSLIVFLLSRIVIVPPPAAGYHKNVHLYWVAQVCDATMTILVTAAGYQKLKLKCCLQPEISGCALIV
jgi:hypothetical protein